MIENMTEIIITRILEETFKRYDDKKMGWDRVESILLAIIEKLPTPKEVNDD